MRSLGDSLRVRFSSIGGCIDVVLLGNITNTVDEAEVLYMERKCIYGKG